MIQGIADGIGRKPRRTVTYRSQTGIYFGFTEFNTNRALPHAAGIYMLATDTVGPDRWRIILIGETASFARETLQNPAAREAIRRGANRVLLHFSPFDQMRRIEAAKDLWMDIRSPLVSWTAETIRQTA